MTEVLIRNERNYDIQLIDKLSVDSHASGMVQLTNVCIIGEVTRCDIVRMTKDEAEKVIKALEEAIK